MGAIPNWMWQVGAILKGADMSMDLANNGLNLYDNINGMIDKSNYRDDAQKLQDDPYAKVGVYAPSKKQVKRDAAGNITEASTGDYNAMLESQRNAALQQQAKPLQQFLTNRLARGWTYDPEFNTQDLLDAEGIQPDMRNPVVQQTLADFTRKAAEQKSLTDLSKPENFAALYGTDVALADKATEGYKRVAEVPKLQAEANKINSDMADKKELSNATQTFAQKLATDANFMALSPEQKITALMGSFKVTAEDAQKIADATNTYRKTRNVEGGYGAGKDIQYTVDDRTGAVVGTVGTPQDQNRRKSETNITVGDKKGIEGLIAGLPSAATSAAQAVDSNKTIDKMLGLINQGAGGAVGNFRASVSPVAQMFGVDTKGMSDAQLYKTYSNLLKGPLRASVVGPGAVTEYEQKLMDKVTAGGNEAIPAIKEYLGYLKQQGNQKIRTYQSTVNTLQALAPETANAYNNIDIGLRPSPDEIRAELQRRKGK